MAMSEIRKLEAKIRRRKRSILRLDDLRAASESQLDDLLKLEARCQLLDAELARAVHRNDGIRGMQLIAELKPLIAERDARIRAQRRLHSRIERVISKFQKQNEE